MFNGKSWLMENIVGKCLCLFEQYGIFMGNVDRYWYLMGEYECLLVDVDH